jgi:hypothetical protein
MDPKPGRVKIWQAALGLVLEPLIWVEAELGRRGGLGGGCEFSRRLFSTNIFLKEVLFF